MITDERIGGLPMARLLFRLHFLFTQKGQLIQLLVQGSRLLRSSGCFDETSTSREGDACKAGFLLMMAALSTQYVLQVGGLNGSFRHLALGWLARKHVQHRDPHLVSTSCQHVFQRSDFYLRSVLFFSLQMNWVYSAVSQIP